MKFKVGDKVRVREKKDLRQVTRTMDKQREQYAGEVLTIVEIIGSNYITEETEVWWTDEMLEPIEPHANPVKIISGENLFNDNDPIQPPHYRKGEIDLFEAAYRTRPFSEVRAIMEFTAERYFKRYKQNRLEDIDKGIYVMQRLREYEEKEVAE